MNSRQLKSAALKFHVWRVATSVGWDCTQQEIADEIGTSLYSVSRICVKAGWHLREGRRRINFGTFGETSAVDTYMRSDDRIRNREAVIRG